MHLINADLWSIGMRNGRNLSLNGLDLWVFDSLARPVVAAGAHLRYGSTACSMALRLAAAPRLTWAPTTHTHTHRVQPSGPGERAERGTN